MIAAYRDGKVAHLLGLQGGRMEVQMTSWVPGIEAVPGPGGRPGLAGPQRAVR